MNYLLLRFNLAYNYYIKLFPAKKRQNINKIGLLFDKKKYIRLQT